MDCTTRYQKATLQHENERMDGFCEYTISQEICPVGKIFYINPYPANVENMVSS